MSFRYSTCSFNPLENEAEGGLGFRVYGLGGGARNLESCKHSNSRMLKGSIVGGGGVA